MGALRAASRTSPCGLACFIFPMTATKKIDTLLSLGSAACQVHTFQLAQRQALTNIRATFKPKVNIGEHVYQLNWNTRASTPSTLVETKP